MNFDPQNYFSLTDDEIIREGDVQENIEEGTYFLIAKDVIQGLAIGCRVRNVRHEWAGFNDILRKKK